MTWDIFWPDIAVGLFLFVAAGEFGWFCMRKPLGEFGTLFRKRGDRLVLRYWPQVRFAPDLESARRLQRIRNTLILTVYLMCAAIMGTVLVGMEWEGSIPVSVFRAMRWVPYAFIGAAAVELAHVIWVTRQWEKES